ncbi:MAG TPA: hypothetical protein VGO93_08815 [Candidatus Xenobia bacterium]|jgi:hypothetical protein
MDGPTASPHTNLLIHLCLETIEMGAPADRLESTLSTRESGLAVARQDFMERVGAQGPGLLRREVEDVVACFDAYQEALGQLRSYLSTRAIEPLQQAIGDLTQVTPRLMGALEAYDARFMIIGPSQYPIVNVWTKVLDGVRDGTMDTADVEALIEGARDFFSRCLHEVETAPDLDPTLQGMADAYRLLVQALDDLDAYRRERLDARLQAAMEHMATAHRRLQQGVDAYREAHGVGRAAGSQAVNMVMQAANRVLQGSLPGELFGGGLESLFPALKTHFEGLGHIPTVPKQDPQ